MKIYAKISFIFIFSQYDLMMIRNSGLLFWATLYVLRPNSETLPTATIRCFDLHSVVVQPSKTYNRTSTTETVSLGGGVARLRPTEEALQASVYARGR